MEPTSEQQAALEAFTTGDDLVITAGAGTGKTSTLRLLAESRDEPGVYIAFNRAIADEAKAKFPRRVQARTAHSFAAGWARSDAVGANVLNKLKDRPPFQLAVDLLKLEPVSVATAAGVESTHVVAHGPNIELKAPIWQLAVELLGDAEAVEWHLAHSVSDLLEKEIVGRSKPIAQADRNSHEIPKRLEPASGNSVEPVTGTRNIEPNEHADTVLGHQSAQHVRAALRTAVEAVTPTRDLERLFGSISAALTGIDMRLDRRPGQIGYTVIAGEHRRFGSAFGPDFTGPALVNRAALAPGSAQVHNPRAPETETGSDRG